MRSKELFKLPEGALLFNTLRQGLIVKTQLMLWEDRYYCAYVKPIHSKCKAYVTSCRNLQRIPITEENLKKLGFKEVQKYTNGKVLGYRWISLTLYNDNNPKRGSNYVYIRAENNKYLSSIELDIRYIDELQTVLRAIKMKYPKILVNR